MGKSKHYLISEIKYAVSNWKYDFFKWLDVKPEKVLVSNAEAILLPMTWVREAFRWIQSIQNTEVAAIKDIQNYATDAYWTRAFLWQIQEDEKEVRELRRTLNAFKRKIASRERPRFFKSTNCERYIKKIQKGNKSRRPVKKTV